MTVKQRCTIAAAAMLSILTLTATAEFRTWTDADGTKLEAELVEFIAGKVTLKNKEGKTGQVSISYLSADDQKYVLRNTPPKVEIEVNDSTDTENIGGGNRFSLTRTTYEFSIELEKGNSIPYKRKMTAEVYFMGRDPMKDSYIVLKKYVVPFSFAEDNNVEVQLGRLALKELSGNLNAGAEYEGYLVVLLDDTGRVFQTEGSRSKFEEHARVIRQKKESEKVAGKELLPLAIW
jgi:hypothetical protein